MPTTTTCLFAALAITLGIGCATQTESDDAAQGGGGKADGSAATEPLMEVPEDRREHLGAADAECLHVNSTNLEAYPAQVKLFCIPHGPNVAPMVNYIAAVSPGEIGAIYKVFEIPGFSSDVPKDLTFKMSGTPRAAAAADAGA